jgi:hypothetical protein
VSVLSKVVRSFRRSSAEREIASIFEEPTAKARFDRIYARNIWSRINYSRSRSGLGSNDTATANFRRELPAFLATLNPGILFDAPCGDFYYMRKITLPSGWTYIGGDIAPSLIADLRKHHPERQFIEHDLTTDPFPTCDVWLCRHCLFHLSFEDAFRALRNFVKSTCDVALVTNEKEVTANLDIITGHYRPLDLTLPPFNLPPPRRELQDFAGTSHPMVVGLWHRRDIAAALY